MDNVYPIKYKSQKHLEIEDHYVALTGSQGTWQTQEDVTISFRKIGNLNQEIFTIVVENLQCLQEDIYASHYVNKDGQEVILLKTYYGMGSRFEATIYKYIRCFINKEGTWSEVELDKRMTLDEQYEFIQKETKTTMDQEVVNNHIIMDNKKLITIDLKNPNNLQYTQSMKTCELSDEITSTEIYDPQKLSLNKTKLKALHDILNLEKDKYVTDCVNSDGSEVFSRQSHVIIEDSVNEKIKIFRTDGRRVKIRTYKTNHQF